MNKAFEKNLEIEKIKVASAEIVVHGTSEKPYYEIRYYDISDGKYHIGYSSYDLSIVFGWLKECFEIVQEVAEEYNSGWIACSERLPDDAFGCLVTVIDCEPSTQTDFENILPYFVGYDGYSWNDADGNVIPFEVIAWQPLPEPFKESD